MLQASFALFFGNFFILALKRVFPSDFTGVIEMVLSDKPEGNICDAFIICAYASLFFKYAPICISQ